MATVLQLLAVVLPAVIGIGLSLVALSGLVAGASPERRSRATAGPVLAIAAGLGVAGGFAVWQLLAGLSCLFSDAAACEDRAQGATLPIGLIAGALVVVASISGAGLALRTGRIPIAAGSVAGPIALVLAAVVVAGSSGLLQAAASAVSSQEVNDAQAARSAALSLGASEVDPTLTPDGSLVLAVHLTAEVRTSRAISISIDSKILYPRFRIAPPQSSGIEGTYAAPATFTLTPGTTSRYELTFDLRGLSARPAPGRDVASTGGGPAAPGTWLLEMEIVDDAGLTYLATTPVMVVAGA